MRAMTQHKHDNCSMLCKVTGMNQKSLAGMPTSQRTQVVRHVTELPDYLGIT
jgi:hypothetical protein